MGYSSCVECSTEHKWSGHLVVFHKTGNTYDIIKNPETAAKMASMSSRYGFGSNRKAIARDGVCTNKRIAPPEDFSIPAEEIARRPPDPSKWRDEDWGSKILDEFSKDPTGSRTLLDVAFARGEISPIARKRLLLIIS